MDIKPLKDLLDKIDLPPGARLKCFHCPMNAKWVLDKKPLCQEDFQDELSRHGLSPDQLDAYSK